MSPRLERDEWSTGDLIAEGFRNALAPGSRLRIVLVLAVLLGVGFVAFRLLEISVLVKQVETLSDKGRNILIIQGSDPDQPARIDRRSCEKLSKGPNVALSGMLLEQGRSSFPQLGAAVPVYAASPTLIPELAEFDAVVGEELTESEAGQSLLIVQGTQTLNAVAGGHRPVGLSVNSAVVIGIPESVRTSGHCFVVLQPTQNLAKETPSILAQLQVADNPAIGAPLSAESIDPFSVFRERPSHIVPTAIGILMAALLLLTAQLRSSEIAAYRLSGTSRISMLRLLSFESCISASIFWLSGAFSTAVVASQGAYYVLSMLADLLVAAMTSIFVSSVLYYFVVRRSPMDLAKDR